MKRKRTKKIYDRKLLINVSDEMLQRLDQLFTDSDNRSDAIRQCVNIVLDQLETKKRRAEAAELAASRSVAD